MSSSGLTNGGPSPHLVLPSEPTMVDCHPHFTDEEIQARVSVTELNFETRVVLTLPFFSFLSDSPGPATRTLVSNDAHFSSLSVCTHSPQAIHTPAAITCGHLADSPPTTQLREKGPSQIDASPHSKNPAEKRNAIRKMYR